MTAADCDDIEYEGIWGESHIAVRSERCFRDHSPGDTVISLGDDGQVHYTYPVLSFRALSHSDLRLDSSSRLAQSDNHHDSVAETDNTSVVSALTCDTLIAIGKHVQPGSGIGLSPLTRYRRDVQGHERLALGMKAEDIQSNFGSQSPPLCPETLNGVMKCGQTSTISSLHLDLAQRQTPNIDQGPSRSSDVSSPAEQLRSLLEIIETSGRNDEVSPEEQAEYLRKA
ncbi:uncharacterized protein F4812DRAFT_215045 [Daldinia caldariorum]|uniref:uncharacterized protein n=1 Tax=Daldinia caldariorum TaxID=326644 RepID=UPI0020083FB4|nr:uncharacterized protein F4812DRAFT_215045 [Daldinia caldariorum]KAI1464188.1 hypothetical protein F4812DRAFT_215045 [Daldinia caldariorum]